MKAFKKLLYIVPLLGMMATSCTDVENIQVEHIGGYNTMDNEKSDAYYADLRAWKETARNYGRPVAFGWYSNWAPSGVMRKGYLSSIPDSMDIVSMWSGAPGRYEITEAQKKDKEFAQKVKGIKILEVQLLSHLGKGRTPNSIYAGVEKQAEEEGWSDRQLTEAKKLVRWDFWGFTSHDLSNTENLNAAFVNFAKAIADSLVVGDWDGYDIDWEPGAGFNDKDGTLSSSTNLAFLVKELGKYIGPKSDPDGNGHKLLCIDGEIYNLPVELDECVDYWIRQTYGQSQPSFAAPGRPEKVIITENFESGATWGGHLLKQAAWMPETGYKGGCGAYRFDNDYENEPDYKWMRQAIQINQAAFHERMSQPEEDKEEE